MIFKDGWISIITLYFLPLVPGREGGEADDEDVVLAEDLPFADLDGAVGVEFYSDARSMA